MIHPYQVVGNLSRKQISSVVFHRQQIYCFKVGEQSCLYDLPVLNEGMNGSLLFR